MTGGELNEDPTLFFYFDKKVLPYNRKVRPGLDLLGLAMENLARVLS